jgi:hypothetical protein
VKDHLVDLVRDASTPAQAQNIAREYLQARLLQSLQDAGAMTTLAFHGGTALRFLYATPRYSEDLDFTLERSPAAYDFRGHLKAIRESLEAEGYAVELKVNDRRTVHSASVRFRGLPYELGFSPHRGQVLAVKIEVDTNPPAGARRVRPRVVSQRSGLARAELGYAQQCSPADGLEGLFSNGP